MVEMAKKTKKIEKDKNQQIIKDKKLIFKIGK